MKFNKDRCKSPVPGKEEPLAVVQLEDCHTGELLCAKGTGVLMGSELDVSLKCTLAAEMANNVLGCISRSTANNWREGIIPFYMVLIRSTMFSILHPVMCLPIQKGHVKWQ